MKPIHRNESSTALFVIPVMIIAVVIMASRPQSWFDIWPATHGDIQRIEQLIRERTVDCPAGPVIFLHEDFEGLPEAIPVESSRVPKAIPVNPFPIRDVTM